MLVEKKKSKCGILKMGQQHMIFASYIAPAQFLKVPSIERANVVISCFFVFFLFNYVVLHCLK